MQAVRDLCRKIGHGLITCLAWLLTRPVAAHSWLIGPNPVVRRIDTLWGYCTTLGIGLAIAALITAISLTRESNSKADIANKFQLRQECRRSDLSSEERQLCKEQATKLLLTNIWPSISQAVTWVTSVRERWATLTAAWCGTATFFDEPADVCVIAVIAIVWHFHFKSPVDDQLWPTLIKACGLMGGCVVYTFYARSESVITMIFQQITLYWWSFWCLKQSILYRRKNFFRALPILFYAHFAQSMVTLYMDIVTGSQVLENELYVRHATCLSLYVMAKCARCYLGVTTHKFPPELALQESNSWHSFLSKVLRNDWIPDAWVSVCNTRATTGSSLILDACLEAMFMCSQLMVIYTIWVPWRTYLFCIINSLDRGWYHSALFTIELWCNVYNFWVARKEAGSCKCMPPSHLPGYFLLRWETSCVRFATFPIITLAIRDLWRVQKGYELGPEWQTVLVLMLFLSITRCATCDVNSFVATIMRSAPAWCDQCDWRVQTHCNSAMQTLSTGAKLKISRKSCINAEVQIIITAACSAHMSDQTTSFVS